MRAISIRFEAICMDVEINMHDDPIQKTLTNGFGVDDALNIIPVDATMK